MELDEGKELSAMLETCRHVLPDVEGRDDALAGVIRDTCRAIEARLVELGIRFDSVFDHTHWKEGHLRRDPRATTVVREHGPPYRGTAASTRRRPS